VRENGVRPAAIAHARERSAGAEIGEDEQADFLAIVAGHDDVLRDGGQQFHRLDAQRANADPRARHQLEIFRHASVEEQAFVRIVGVGEAHRVADHVEALVVEGRFRQVVALPVAGRDIGASNADFEFAAIRREFQFDAGRRRADVAGAIGLKVTVRGQRRRLGRPPRRHHRDRMARRLARQVCQNVPDILGQCRARVENES
jgi:hypothetical protein